MLRKLHYFGSSPAVMTQVVFIKYSRDFKHFHEILTGKLNLILQVMFQIEKDFNNSIGLENYFIESSYKSPQPNLMLRKLYRLCEFALRKLGNFH